MIIGGFDQAPSAIGYAFGEPGFVPTRGVWNPPNYGENTTRLLKDVRVWARALLESSGIQRLYLEHLIMRTHGFHRPTFYKQAVVIAAIESAAVDMGLLDEVYAVEVADWRREFYRGSRPTKTKDDQSKQWKEMALIECADRGWLVEDHNAAEACGIWFFGCCKSDSRTYNSHKVEARREEVKRWNSEAI